MNVTDLDRSGYVVLPSNLIVRLPIFTVNREMLDHQSRFNSAKHMFLRDYKFGFDQFSRQHERCKNYFVASTFDRLWHI